MKEFFKGPLFRALLAMLAFVVLSLMVWFLGPFLSVGETQPLESVAVRVSLIGLMSAGLLAWAMEISATLVWAALGAATLCLLIWHGGQMLGFGGFFPLKPVWARVLCIGLLLLTLLSWAIYRLYRALQNDEKLVQRWLHREGSKPALAREEVRQLGEAARQTLTQLRQMQLSQGPDSGFIGVAVRRLMEGKRYLYELPWYILIGKPGAGKSSVVMNAGLTFPLPEQMGAASVRLMLERSAGTQQCDWWLTNEAVFLDTAGRYTEQATADEEAQLVNQAEWKGFLGVLRQVRPRAPINGALVVVDVIELLEADETQLVAMAAQLRARLEELRSQLGIRFPVYLVLAKVDALAGFSAYFSSLTAEARTQVWGFTLPWSDNSSALGKLNERAGRPLLSRKKATAAMLAEQDSFGDSATLANMVGKEFAALVDRVSNGVMGRLQEEFELDNRQSLYLLPYEMKALQAPLQALVQALFANSRYDTTQIQPSLRGVYLTSAMQAGQEVVAQRVSLFSRLEQSFKHRSDVFLSSLSRAKPKARKSFFLTDLMQRVVFAEAHLVKPNLRWEARMRLLRWLGHGVVLLLFVWLWGALTLSNKGNKEYLHDINQKTAELTEQMQRWLVDTSVQQSDRVLNMARGLPMHEGLDLESPDISYKYGLYVASGINKAAQDGYGRLLDRLVLPHVIAHLEKVMRDAVAKKDPQKAYQALRVYLLLHDGDRYVQSPEHAIDARHWVGQEWSNMEQLSGSSAMVGHMEALFSGQRVVQSPTPPNDDLVRQVREYLEKQPSAERLYERIKQTLLPGSGGEFNLVKAIGPQAALIFSRASGASLERGIPSLFTYDGYHEVFSKQLAAMLTAAQQADEWVMGNVAKSSNAATKSAAEQKNEKRDLIEEVRRRYLQEYANLWERFLGDVRLVNSEPSATLAYEINIVRQLVEADSPLLRLARIATRETTLSRPLSSAINAQPEIGDQVGGVLQSGIAKAGFGVRPEQKLEKQWVDDRFSALREVVLGQSDDAPKSSAAGKASLEGIAAALNEYYTFMVVADTAITAGSLPPAGADAAIKLRIEAGKMPAPLREVLLSVSAKGVDKVAKGASSVLRVPAQMQVDRLMGLMSSAVIEPCQRLIAGRYPFANTAQEVSADDFNTFFAKGGAADEFFQKHLSHLVDTSVRPWRYKSAAAAQFRAGGEANSSEQMSGSGQSAPTLTGELLQLMTQSGPNPDVFAQIAQIRDMFFRQQDGRRLGWKGEYKVISLDEKVMEWVIDFDGQVQRYAHGPIQSIAFDWPGPRGGSMVELHANPRVRAETSSLMVRGPWAWLRVIEQGRLVQSTQPGKQVVEYMFDDRRALLEITSAGPSPFNNPLLRNFTCPSRSL